MQTERPMGATNLLRREEKSLFWYNRIPRVVRLNARAGVGGRCRHSPKRSKPETKGIMLHTFGLQKGAILLQLGKRKLPEAQQPPLSILGSETFLFCVVFYFTVVVTERCTV